MHGGSGWGYAFDVGKDMHSLVTSIALSVLKNQKKQSGDTVKTKKTGSDKISVVRNGTEN